MSGTEHILLESDEREVPTLETARKIHARVVLRGGRWRRSMQLAVIDNFYLSVRTMRAQFLESRYVVDLRCVDPSPRLTRRVAWGWLAACAVFLALGILGTREIAGSPAPWWRHDWLAATAALFGMAACTLFAAILLTMETLTLISACGRATLVRHTGGIGTLRAFRKFLPHLDAHLGIAADARRRSRAAHLRDEMREHFRLRNAGVLAEAEYDDAKRRLLAMHGPPATGAPIQKVRETAAVPPRSTSRA